MGSKREIGAVRKELISKVVEARDERSGRQTYDNRKSENQCQNNIKVWNGIQRNKNKK